MLAQNLAQGHIKMISFFSRPWHPSAFHLLKCNLLRSSLSDLSDFRDNFATGKDLSYSVFSAAEFFFNELLAKNVDFSDFF